MRRLFRFRPVGQAGRPPDDDRESGQGMVDANKENIITLFNKTDLEGTPEGTYVQGNIHKLAMIYPRAIRISARTKEGISEVQDRMMDALGNLFLFEISFAKRYKLPVPVVSRPSSLSNR